MSETISVTCSGCGKTTTIPEYSKFGLPYHFFICKCGEETELTPKITNAKWWVGMWMPLVGRIRKEFGDSVADKMTEFAIEQREYILERDHLHEEYLVSRGLKECEKR